MPTWNTISTPVVGGKLTAAGFGTQVVNAVTQLQSTRDSDIAGLGDQSKLDLNGVWSFARPGFPCAGLTGAAQSVNGTATVVATPASGRRVMKSLALNATTAGTTVTGTLAGTTLFAVTFNTPGLLTLPACVPIANGETFAVTTSAATSVTATWADRADTLVYRQGFVTGTSGSGTLRAAGTAGVITQLWLANANASAAGNITVTVGAAVVNVPMPAGSLLTIEDPVVIPASTAVTYAISGGVACSILANGY